MLSGGEQVKILLISLFLKGNNFLLIDEPTNHLDIESMNNLINYTMWLSVSILKMIKLI